MEKVIVVIFAVAALSGCGNQPALEDVYDQENGFVKIYSSSDISSAQVKADSYCGKHAYYLKVAHDANVSIASKYPSLGRLENYIPFQCDPLIAAAAGNPEAEVVAGKIRDEAYKSLDKAKQHQYEVHKAYAKKHGGDSYSVVNPDGSIESHSFGSEGQQCHGSSSQYGANVYCD